jgi:hypothetical protein
LADEGLAFGKVQVFAGMGVSTVQTLVGEQALQMVGDTRLSWTSPHLPCVRGHYSQVEEQQHTEADMRVLAGSCSGCFVGVQEEPEDTHAIDSVPEEVA